MITDIIHFFAYIFNCIPIDTSEDSKKKDLQVPSFNAGSAFQYIQSQVDFGPRVPNTPAHAETEEFIINQLESFGATVQTQKFEADTYDGEVWNLTNIIGSIQPEKTKRILLAAHWDT